MTDLTKADLRDRLGNIDQIRDILFGPQVREFVARLDQLERTLANQQQELRGRIDEVRQAVTADLRSELEALDKKLRNSVVKDEEEKQDIRQQIDTLNKRLGTVSDSLEDALEEEIETTLETLNQRLKEAATKDEEEKFELRQQIDLLSKKLSSNVEALDEAIDTQTNTLREDFVSSRDSLQEELSDLRTQIFEELERYVSMLSEVKISKDDMAELLFELGLRLKGTEFVPELQEMGSLAELEPEPAPKAIEPDAEEAPKTRKTRAGRTRSSRA
ncbi:MAG: hypothetical protein ACO4AJ_11925 [Prochlorothrix sp.]